MTLPFVSFFIFSDLSFVFLGDKRVSSLGRHGSNLLKRSFRKTSLFVLTKTAVMEKVLSQPHISSYYCNVVIKILEKYLLRSSVLEMNFQKLFVSILIQDFNHKFQNTFFEEQFHQLILVVSYTSYSQFGNHKHTHTHTHTLFSKGIKFDYPTWRGESEKLKKEVEVW